MVGKCSRISASDGDPRHLLCLNLAKPHRSRVGAPLSRSPQSPFSFLSPLHPLFAMMQPRIVILKDGVDTSQGQRQEQQRQQQRAAAAAASVSAEEAPHARSLCASLQARASSSATSTHAKLSQRYSRQRSDPEVRLRTPPAQRAQRCNRHTIETAQRNDKTDCTVRCVDSVAAPRFPSFPRLTVALSVRLLVPLRCVALFARSLQAWIS